MGKTKSEDLIWDLPAGAIEKEPKQASGGSDIPRRVPVLRHPQPLRARRRRCLRMWVPLLLLLPELLPAVPAQKLSALTVRPPRRRAPSGPVPGAPERGMRPPGGERRPRLPGRALPPAPAGRERALARLEPRPGGSSAAARPRCSRHRRPAGRLRGERGPRLRSAGFTAGPRRASVRR